MELNSIQMKEKKDLHIPYIDKYSVKCTAEQVQCDLQSTVAMDATFKSKAEKNSENVQMCL